MKFGIFYEHQLPRPWTIDSEFNLLQNSLVQLELADGLATVKPLIPDAVEAGFASYRKTGIYPVNHTLVVRDELLQQFPDLAADLFRALTVSKQAYLGGLERGGELSAEDALTVQLENGVGGDPFPYGVASNRKALEALVQMAFDQHITPRKLDVEELFAPGTLELAG